jgi:hypothetical protein
VRCALEHVHLLARAAGVASCLGISVIHAGYGQPYSWIGIAHYRSAGGGGAYEKTIAVLPASSLSR